jgi:putative ABC transport system permease protein
MVDMDGAIDITYLSLGLCYLLLLLPLGVSALLKLRFVKSLLYSVARMTVQLLLIGFFLMYIFQLNRPVINLAWFLVMVGSATGTVIYRSELKITLLLGPAFISILLVSGLILFYFNAVVVRLENLFDAKYFIAIGGMILGNSLRGIIVGLTSFYKQLRRNENRFHYALAGGATLLEGILPYLRDSLKEAFSPLIATMVTIGIVSLPGMMTGQILGGSSPLVAVKYQLAIMIAVCVSTILSTGLTIMITVKFAFTETGTLKSTVFRRRTEKDQEKKIR